MAKNTREYELKGETVKEKISDAQGAVLQLKVIFDAIDKLATNDDDCADQVRIVARLAARRADEVQLGLDYLSIDLHHEGSRGRSAS